MPYKIKDADKGRFIKLLRKEDFIFPIDGNDILLRNPSKKLKTMLGKDSPNAKQNSWEKDGLYTLSTDNFSEKDLEEIKKIKDEQKARETRGGEASTTSDQPQTEAACDNLPSLTPDLRKDDYQHDSDTESEYEMSRKEGEICESFQSEPEKEGAEVNSPALSPSTILNEAQEQAALPSAQTEASASK